MCGCACAFLTYCPIVRFHGLSSDLFPVIIARDRVIESPSPVVVFTLSSNFQRDVVRDRRDRPGKSTKIRSGCGPTRLYNKLQNIQVSGKASGSRLLRENFWLVFRYRNDRYKRRENPLGSVNSVKFTIIDRTALVSVRHGRDVQI